LQDRITRLSSGVAIIRVGANSEVELIEKKQMDIDFDNQEQAVSLGIFKKALQSPFNTMAQNAGHNPEVLRLTMGECQDMEGYNFLTGNKENLFHSGVIDPAKVTRCALKNAVSVAGTLLLTNHSIVH
jgi:chaperonin GroEL